MSHLESQLATAKALFGSLGHVYSAILRCHGQDPPDESFLTSLTENRDNAHAIALLQKLDSEIGIPYHQSSPLQTTIDCDCCAPETVVNVLIDSHTGTGNCQ